MCQFTTLLLRGTAAARRFARPTNIWLSRVSIQHPNKYIFLGSTTSQKSRPNTSEKSPWEQRAEVNTTNTMQNTSPRFLFSDSSWIQKSRKSTTYWGGTEKEKVFLGSTTKLKSRVEIWDRCWDLRARTKPAEIKWSRPGEKHKVYWSEGQAS